LKSSARVRSDIARAVARGAGTEPIGSDKSSPHHADDRGFNPFPGKSGATQAKIGLMRHEEPHNHKAEKNSQHASTFPSAASMHFDEPAFAIAFGDGIYAADYRRRRCFETGKVPNPAAAIKERWKTGGDNDVHIAIFGVEPGVYALLRKFVEQKAKAGRRSSEPKRVNNEQPVGPPKPLEGAFAFKRRLLLAKVQ
jgi:hypothetical protein